MLKDMPCNYEGVCEYCEHVCVCHCQHTNKPCPATVVVIARRMRRFIQYMRH
jgi:hypothetical protein